MTDRPLVQMPVWKIHAFNAWDAAVRLSPTGPLVLLADHIHDDTPILIYRFEQLETSVAALRVRGWIPESGSFEIPNGPCYTFCDPNGRTTGHLRKPAAGNEPGICRSH